MVPKFYLYYEIFTRIAGGMGTGSNQAGAAYGTGYCDAQCPQDIKFINGIVCELVFVIVVLLYHRPTLSDGPPHTALLVLVNSDLAAMSLISGKPIRSALPTLLTHAPRTVLHIIIRYPLN